MSPPPASGLALLIFVAIRAVVQITTLYWEFFLHIAKIDFLFS